MSAKQRGVFEKDPGSGVWYIQYFENGQRHREKVGRKQAAVDAYYQRKLEIREGRFRPPERLSLTFEELLREAFADRKLRLAPLSYDSDERRGKVLLEWFGKAAAERITPAMISERLRGLIEGGLAKATANRYKALLSAVFTWGVRAEKVETNPVRNVQSFREARLRVRFLSDDEEEALRKAIREDYPEAEAELDVALHTGMRRNEFYRLKWEQVDLDRELITIEGKEHANSQAPSQRFLRMNSEARAAFETLYRRSNGSAYVCAGVHTGSETERDRRDWFEASIEKAGIENFTYHDLRHTFASRLRMAGVELAAIAEMLGHSGLGMVLRYAHLAPDHQRANIEKLVKPRKPLKTKEVA